jgi:hypothetical protein
MIAAVVGWLVAATALLALIYRRPLSAAWREPVLRAPVLILESDDWGYGPSVQADRLARIADVLASCSDAAGRHPVATLGIILAGPDTQRIRADGCRTYYRLTLGEPALSPVLDAVMSGSARGLFAPQLHGLEHFWPASLMRSAANDAAVRDWLTRDAFPATEKLPSPLQSRWVDASVLPANPLPEHDVERAVLEEARVFAAVMGSTPEVVVPATFLWTDAVERAWVRAGVRVVVTPGVRNETRDADGRVVAGAVHFFNGQRAPDGAIYVVRDAYFEPALGQTHEHALAALRSKARAARPALLEMHRFNFIGDSRSAQTALDELRALLESAVAGFPSLQFMSTAELARSYRDGSSLIESRIGTRLHFFIRRLTEVSGLRKLAWLTGAALPACLAYLLTRPGDSLTARSAA